MKTTLMVLACFAFSSARAPGQLVAASGPAPAPKPAGPETIRLTASPAPEPRPSLSWLLLPPVTELTPGNAAQLYLAADVLTGKEATPETRGKIDKWLEVPLSRVPVEDARTLVRRYDGALHQLELASRREYVHWDLPLRNEGFRAALPSLGDRAHLARVLALRIRLHLAQKQHQQAVHDLQTGMAMARHLGEGSTLIHSFVGVAVAAQMVPRMDELIAAPGSPNLYWALTALPRPIIDLSGPLADERSSLLLTYPDLRDLRTGRLSAVRWQEIMADLSGMMGKGGGGGKSDWPQQLGDTLSAVKRYSRAKKALIALGYPPEKVEAMPVHQAIGLHQLEEYERLRDEAFRWFYLPYWQAKGPMKRADDEMTRAAPAHPDNPLLRMLPSLGRAYFLTTKVDRRIAALRCVEAIRMYAATHDGRLPGKPADVTEVPLPHDPTTGKPFAYSVTGDTCVLSSPAPPGEEPKHALRYELTLTK